MDKNDLKNRKNVIESSHYPETDEEDDFFERFDRERGISDDQLKEKLENNTVNHDLEVTKTLQTLPPDEQEVFMRTGIIHFDREVPVEEQVQKAILLKKLTEAKQKRVFRIILILMIIGIVVSVLGILGSSYLKSHSAPTAAATKTNPLAVDSSEEAVKISAAAFPDAVFRQYIKDNADKNSDGKLSPDERNSLLIITLTGNANLTSVKGIELFPLLQAANLSNTSVSEIDLTGNTLLENINVSGTKVAVLDLSKNLAVTKVNVSNTAIASLILPIPSSVQDINVTGTSLTCTKDSSNLYNACSVKQ